MFERIIFLLALAELRSSSGETLVLPNGQILGREDVTSENKRYYAFEKIPYAAPPVGDLRFEPPQPVENWEGVLNTTKLDVSCYQLALIMSRMPNPGTQSEDCLFLNVFTPKLPTSDDGETLPVMVFIHGGGFTVGSSSNNPPDMFINHDVILVSLNYRLGVFGFISTQDDVIPGNNGLKDQAFALRWIQDNIGFFGGDPEKVTIFGQSAGAGSCSYHLLNLNSEGLFSGVIQESGTFLSPGMFLRDSRPIAFGTGAALDSTFESSDSRALLQLLRNAEAQDLNAAAQSYASTLSHEWDNFAEVGSYFAPVVEAENPDAFITEKMYVALKNGRALPVPIIVGFNSEEKIGMVQGEDSVISIATAIDENLEIIVPTDMRIPDSADRLEMGRKIREIYTGGEAFVDHLGDAIRYSSDNFLTRSSIKQAELFSKIAPTYFYVFSFSGELDQNLNSFEGAGNVSHGAELSYLFCSGTACTDETIDAADLHTRTRLITLWTNFAKYGNPTPELDDKLQNVTWPAVSIDEGDFHYLNIGTDLLVENHPKGEAYSKWIELYDSLGIDDFDSY